MGVARENSWIYCILKNIAYCFIFLNNSLNFLFVNERRLNKDLLRKEIVTFSNFLIKAAIWLEKKLVSWYNIISLFSGWIYAGLFI